MPTSIRPVPTLSGAFPEPEPSSTSPVSWRDARILAHEAPHRLPTRRVPLADAVGLTSADILQSARPMPAFDTSAMDGYATAGQGPWSLRGAVRAGQDDEQVLLPGECVEISTGARVPGTADRVLQLERALRQGDVVIGEPAEPGTHIRRAGEDVAAGAVLVPPGREVTPAMLGLAAMCGLDDLMVRQQPRVLVLVTGDELVHQGSSGPGLVRDAIGPMLPGLIRQFGGDLVGARHVPDVPHGSLAAQVAEFLQGDSADVAVVSGSTSVGVTDQLRPALRTAGARFVVDRVACRPGHPQLLAGVQGGNWVVGLPGNPFAALAACYTLLEPLISGYTGRRLRAPLRLPVVGLTSKATVDSRLVPASWEDGGAQLVSGHRSGSLWGASLADGIAVLPRWWQNGDAAPVLSLV